MIKTRSGLFASAALALLSAVAVLGAAPSPAAQTANLTYTVVEGKSSFRIHVGKSGIFSFAGHKHEVEAPVSGSVVADPERLEASSVSLVFATHRLRVLEEGEPEGDAPKVQAKMHGPDVLDAVRFREIRFQSKRVTGKSLGGGNYDLKVVGDLSLRGLVVELTLPIRVSIAGPTLTATGTVKLRHDQFGMKPVSVGGVVKVAQEIPIDFEIVAELG